jgi:hypothetical protein
MIMINRREQCGATETQRFRLPNEQQAIHSQCPMKAGHELILQRRFHVDEQIATAHKIKRTWWRTLKHIASFKSHASLQARLHHTVITLV